MIKQFKRALIGFSITLLSSVALANVIVPMYLVSQKGDGKAVGEVTFKKSRYGVLVIPKLHSLPPGLHGFHIHELPNCDKLGMAAGGHLDPLKTSKHLGPYNNQGHLGDLPVLMVNSKGAATTPLLAPKLTLNDLIGHSLMIHADGDNYSDTPKKLGGGGARIACGVIK